MTQETSGSHNTHARKAPSASKTWTTCTGSVALAEANKHRIPEDSSTSYSIEGTTAHDLAADLFNGKITLADIPEDFREPVSLYHDYCMAKCPSGVTPLVEVSVPLFYQLDEYGTCDFAVVTNTKITVIDLKYGAGILVQADSNTQLAIYSMSLVKLFEDVHDFTDDTEVEIIIFQPRHREARATIPWVLTLAELRKFCEKIGYAAIQVENGVNRVRSKILDQRTEVANVSCRDILEAAPGLKFAPQDGDDGTCRFCKNRGFCEVRLAAATEELAVGFTSGTDLLALMPDLDKDEKKLPVEGRVAARFEKMNLPYEAITDDYLVRMFAASKWIRSCLDDVEELLEQRVLGGEKIPGTKIVLGRAGNRDWVNEEAADKFLKNQKLKEAERYDFKLKSPTKIEALLKDKLESTTRTKNLFDSLVTRSDPKKVLALESDKREAVEGNSEGFEPEVPAIDIDAYEV